MSNLEPSASVTWSQEWPWSMLEPQISIVRWQRRWTPLFDKYVIISGPISLPCKQSVCRLNLAWEISRFPTCLWSKDTTSRESALSLMSSSLASACPTLQTHSRWYTICLNLALKKRKRWLQRHMRQRVTLSSLLIISWSYTIAQPTITHHCELV